MSNKRTNSEGIQLTWITLLAVWWFFVQLFVRVLSRRAWWTRSFFVRFFLWFRNFSWIWFYFFVGTFGNVCFSYLFLLFTFWFVFFFFVVVVLFTVSLDNDLNLNLKNFNFINVRQKFRQIKECQFSLSILNRFYINFFWLFGLDILQTNMKSLSGIYYSKFF